jgi:hypothetical protein
MTQGSGWTKSDGSGGVYTFSKTDVTATNDENITIVLSGGNTLNLIIEVGTANEIVINDSFIASTSDLISSGSSI